MSGLSIKIPTEVHHFYKKNRILATVVGVQLEDGAYAVGIARANKREKHPSKKEGRIRAEDRVVRGLGFYNNPITDRELALADQALNLFVKMDHTKYEELCKSNPFKQFLCPYGITKEDLKAARADAKKRKKEAQQLRKEQHQLNLKLVEVIKTGKLQEKRLQEKKMKKTNKKK